MSTHQAVVELQYAVVTMYERRGFVAGPQTLLLGAMEELGEVAMAMLLTRCPDFRASPRKLGPEWEEAWDIASEVGDCITYLLAMCYRLGVVPSFKWDRE